MQAWIIKQKVIQKCHFALALLLHTLSNLIQNEKNMISKIFKNLI